MKMFLLPGAAIELLPKCALNFIVLPALVAGVASAYAQSSPRTAPSETRTFCGSTPWGKPISRLLPIPTNATAELMEWKLTLHRDQKTLAPSGYELRCDYGLTTPGKPGIGRSAGTLERKGAWSISKGSRSNRAGITYSLDGSLSLSLIHSNVLQVLNSDGTLMAGNGGWSYTLNATDSAETIVDPSLALTVPDMSYQISPLATGPNVFGVFEGRTPAQGIARMLKIAIPAAATKAKWRVTLYQDPDSRAPTTYKIEGTFFRPAAREGKWNIMHPLKDPDATIYKLISKETEPALYLLKGDDNVLFFLDANERPLVGNCEFSYTLNRRTHVDKAVTERTK